jgi:hypothetical protein
MDLLGEYTEGCVTGDGVSRRTLGDRVGHRDLRVFGILGEYTEGCATGDGVSGDGVSGDGVSHTGL